MSDKNGVFYCVIWSFGKPPLLTDAEIQKMAMTNWNLRVYDSERGRRIGIRHFQNLDTEFIFTCELSLQELMQKSKPALLPQYDRRLKGDIPQR